MPPIEGLKSSGVFSLPTWITNNINTVCGTVLSENIYNIAKSIDWFDGEFVRDMARDGVDLEITLPDGSRPYQRELFSGSEEGKAYMLKIIEGGLESGYNRTATRRELHRGIYNPLFMIPKSDPKKFRDVVDFAAEMQKNGTKVGSTNASTIADVPSIQPGNSKQIRELLSWLHLIEGVPKEDIRLAGSDVTQAYKHIRIMESKQYQMLIRVGGITYVQTRLPFGSSASCSIFLRFINTMQAFWAKHGIISVSYIDDFLVIGVAGKNFDSALDFLRGVLAYCGFDVSVDKSDEEGKTEVTYIGLVINVVTWTLRIKPETIEKLRLKCSEMLAGAVSHKKIASIAGSMLAAGQVYTQLKPVSSFFFWLLRVDKPYRTARLTHYLQLTLSLINRDIAASIVWPPHELERQHDTRLAMDASHWGFGAVGYDVEGTPFFICEPWTKFEQPFSNLHVNDLEFIAFLITIHILAPHVARSKSRRYKVVTSLTDNTTTISWANKMYASMKDLTTEFKASPLAPRRNLTTVKASPPDLRRDLTTVKASPPELRRNLTTVKASPPDLRQNVRQKTWGASPTPGRLLTNRDITEISTLRQTWLIHFAQYLQTNDLVSQLSHIKGEKNLMPDAFSRANEASKMRMIQFFLQQNPRARRLRVPASWDPVACLL